MSKIKSTSIDTTVVNFISNNVTAAVSPAVTNAVSTEVSAAISSSLANITIGPIEPRISNIIVTDLNYSTNVIDDTEIGPLGGYIRIIGSGFLSNSVVLFNNNATPSYSYISSTEMRAQIPAIAAGGYFLSVTNWDGATALRILSISSGAVWVTPSIFPTLSNPGAVLIQLVATGQGTITYSLSPGSSLPSGLSLSPSGLISGNYIPTFRGSVTYNFTVIATDSVTKLDIPRPFILPVIEFAIGQAEFTTPGTFTWTAPTAVTSVCVVCVGGGAGTHQGAGGGGGGLGWKNNITVVPGQNYTVVVGAGGAAGPNSGGDSYFISLETVSGRGGLHQIYTVREGNGGSYTGDGGGNGGQGGSICGGSFRYGGGGGAGGYAGNGGNASASCYTGTAGAGGAGGGGGGGFDVSGGGGGGTGIYGQGANGALGGGSTGGKGGSGGGDGTDGVSNTVGGNGGFPGGGGGGPSGGTGAGGAVRIIWGPNRSFPSTGTLNM